MTPEQAAQLREPFPAEVIGKLPKPTQKDNAKGKCGECGGWHGLPAVHLDFVGHAATTDRLLKVDPDWTWEPMAYGPNGEPLMTNGGMWIWMTIGGVRRPGFGDGANPKEIISDAIRNAAMRFGVALDLWSKQDLHVDEEAPAEKPKAKPAQKPAAAQPIVPSLETLQDRLLEIVAQADLNVPEWREKIQGQVQRPDFKGWLERQIAAGESSLALRAEQEQADREAQVESPAFVAPTGKRGEKAREAA